MTAYIIRRVLYAIPILIGVNLLTFLLFFVVNTPDDMARMQLGTRRVTAEAIEKWKAEQGYDKPMLFNARAAGAGKLTGTIFYIMNTVSKLTGLEAEDVLRDHKAEKRAQQEAQDTATTH